jgi:hypothetical protein
VGTAGDPASDLRGHTFLSALDGTQIHYRKVEEGNRHSIEGTHWGFNTDDLIARIQQELGLSVSIRDGRPFLDLSDVGDVKWPRKLVPETCVAVDPYADDPERRWVFPRYEILIANLDYIGFNAIAVGHPARDQKDERLLRVAADFAGKFSPFKTAVVISKCRLWIGPDTLWRHVAAAVGTPQLVVVPRGVADQPIYSDTTVVVAKGKRTESEALGPLSVAEVAEAVAGIINARLRVSQSVRR